MYIVVDCAVHASLTMMRRVSSTHSVAAAKGEGSAKILSSQCCSCRFLAKYNGVNLKKNCDHKDKKVRIIQALMPLDFGQPL